MTIDLKAERLTLNEVARLLHRHLATVWRWCDRGVRGRKLPSFLLGGRRYVYRTDLDDFLMAHNTAKDNPRSKVISRKAKRRADAAAAKLDQFGIGT